MERRWREEIGHEEDEEKSVNRKLNPRIYSSARRERETEWLSIKKTHLSLVRPPFTISPIVVKLDQILWEKMFSGAATVAPNPMKHGCFLRWPTRALHQPDMFLDVCLLITVPFCPLCPHFVRLVVTPLSSSSPCWHRFEAAARLS